MIVVENAQKLAEAIQNARLNGRQISFVPTMGNLHDGHLSLINEAQTENAFCVVSIFVNPTQFGPGEDLDAYPRTLEADISRLKKQSVDLLYIPSVNEIYPQGKENVALLDVGPIGDILCGTFRPGHFSGVATVVDRLFSIVKPERAIFGAKDFQQVLIIKNMVKQQHHAVEIKVMPTLRESNGLAMSSRNGYLSIEQKQHASLIFKTLQQVAGSIESIDSIKSACEVAKNSLSENGFDVEYIEVRNAQDLSVPVSGDNELVVLTACRLGSTRLIDNVIFKL